MTYAVAHMIYPCLGPLEEESVAACNRITKGIDFALIATIAIVSGLILAEILQLDLPPGIGTDIAYGLIGLGGLIIVSDVIASFCPRKDKSSNEDQATNFYEMSASYYDIIVKTPKVDNSSEETQNKSLFTNSVEIFPGIHLGNARCFAQTTHIPCSIKDNGPELDSSNPENFTTVITVCPLTDIAKDIQFETGVSEDLLREKFKKNKVDWYTVGLTCPDEAYCWASVVHDCDSPNNQLHQMPQIFDTFDKLLVEKTKRIQHLSILELFEPIFEIIDHVVMEKKKVLIHCQAADSRSPTLLAAYFINRYKVTADQAINFLQSKVSSVKPKFTEQLKQYETILRKFGHYEEILVNKFIS